MKNVIVAIFVCVFFLSSGCQYNSIEINPILNVYNVYQKNLVSIRNNTSIKLYYVVGVEAKMGSEWVEIPPNDIERSHLLKATEIHIIEPKSKKEIFWDLVPIKDYYYELMHNQNVNEYRFVIHYSNLTSAVFSQGKKTYSKAFSLSLK